MRMAPFATAADVDEALRLFQVSTLDAAMSGNLSGMLQVSALNNLLGLKSVFSSVAQLLSSGHSIAWYS